MKITWPFKYAGQLLRSLLFGAALLVLIAAWLALREATPPIIPTAPDDALTPRTSPVPAPPLPEVATTPPPRRQSEPARVLHPISDVRQAAVGDVAQPASVMEMEREYLRTTDPRERAIAAASVVSIGTAEAVAAAARLFSYERDPRAREALVAALADLPAEDFLDARLPILTKALAHSQPRSVRITALDVLTALDDPRALALLQRAAHDDPDKDIREAAAARAATK